MARGGSGERLRDVLRSELCRLDRLQSQCGDRRSELFQRGRRRRERPRVGRALRLGRTAVAGRELHVPAHRDHQSRLRFVVRSAVGGRPAADPPAKALGTARYRISVESTRHHFARRDLCRRPAGSGLLHVPVSTGDTPLVCPRRRRRPARPGAPAWRHTRSCGIGPSREPARSRVRGGEALSGSGAYGARRGRLAWGE